MKLCQYLKNGLTKLDMLLSVIKSLNHNINQEILIVFSNDNVCKGYYLYENLGSNLSFDVTISTQLKEISNINNFICLSSKDIIKLTNGDILLFRPNGSLNLIYKSTSQDNSLFVTEQCNNHCLMCSQPPRIKDDIDYYFNLNTKLIDLLPQELIKIGVTGGEPTLLGEKLLQLLRKISNQLPNTAIHLLSNGRRFADIVYAKQISQIEFHDILIGIPFHSDFHKDHDFIAQSEGAYYETLKGLYNLARFNQNIELRIVVNQVNYKRLPQIAEYIYRNLPFVSHVAFMALEYTGFVPKNNEKIWVDPIVYRTELERAVLNLASWGLNVSIFNLPLCLVNNTLYEYARKSISDWKVKYFEACYSCTLKDECGGDFGTSIKHSSNIAAIV
jgi:His-Xaa-Ser system radical SAM maturase HxsC